MKIITRRRLPWESSGFKVQSTSTHDTLAISAFICEGLRDACTVIFAYPNIPKEKMWVKFRFGQTFFSHFTGERTKNMIKSVMGLFKIEGTLYDGIICQHVIRADRRSLARWSA